ncbi:MAG: glycosyltransferase family 2 protein [Rhodospirillales bacterium]|nr:glycosyltransferase family 2 protein [Rhodospirillales bacterium]
MNVTNSQSHKGAAELVSIVIPVFNEQDALPILLERLQAVIDQKVTGYTFELIFIDDGSQDNSLKVALKLAQKEPRLRVIELRSNFGQTAALQAGFDAARGEIIISLDADLQHFPEDIPLFLEKIESGVDVACGWRHDRQEGIVRRWPSRVANMLIRKVSGLVIHDIGTTFRAYRKDILDDILLLGENHRFVPVFAKVAGARIEEVPIQNIERPHGESNYGISRTLNVFIDLFFLYFYTRYLDRPIRIFGKIAILTFGSASLIALYLLYIFIMTGLPVVRVHSGLFVICAVMYLASLQFIIAGILSELTARMYFTAGGRTPYKIRNEWTTSNIQNADE